MEFLTGNNFRELLPAKGLSIPPSGWLKVFGASTSKMGHQVSCGGFLLGD